MHAIEQLLSRYDPATGEIAGVAPVRRHLGDLGGCFADARAYEAALAAGDPLVYTVSAVEPAGGDGDLHYALGVLQPGRVGAEFFQTKGHLHAWREAAEFYFGLCGEGVLLLEDEASGASRLLPLCPHHAVYVPGRTAHRTINTGRTPLAYLGVYPAKAGHDYATVAERNFRCVVVEREGQPAMIERKELPCPAT